MKLVEAIIILIAAGGSIAFVAWTLLFRPNAYVQFNSRLSRIIYKDLLHLSDDTLDKGNWFPTTKFFLGSQSAYINQGVEQPEKFPRVSGYVRFVGCCILFSLFSAM